MYDTARRCEVSHGVRLIVDAATVARVVLVVDGAVVVVAGRSSPAVLLLLLLLWGHDDGASDGGAVSRHGWRRRRRDQVVPVGSKVDHLGSVGGSFALPWWQLLLLLAVTQDGFGVEVVEGAPALPISAAHPPTLATRRVLADLPMAAGMSVSAGWPT